MNEFCEPENRSPISPQFGPHCCLISPAARDANPGTVFAIDPRTKWTWQRLWLSWTISNWSKQHVRNVTQVVLMASCTRVTDRTLELRGSTPNRNGIFRAMKISQRTCSKTRLQLSDISGNFSGNWKVLKSNDHRDLDTGLFRNFEIERNFHSWDEYKRFSNCGNKVRDCWSTKFYSSFNLLDIELYTQYWVVLSTRFSWTLNTQLITRYWMYTVR